VYIRKLSLRFSSVFLFLILALLYFTLKLVCIQFFRSAYLTSLANKQHNNSIKLEPIRGTIYDRKLRPLALNIAVYSLYANPRIMKPEQKEKAIQALAPILNMPLDDLRERFDKKKYFVWLARKLPVDKVEEIKAMKLRGLDFMKESKRYYPNQSLGAHLIGFAGMDNQGLEGLELLNDKYLKGEFGWAQILQDAKQRQLLIEKNYVPPKDGFSLVLTIDETIQYIAERALDRGMKQFNAKAATIIVMDPKTGEILAMANRPTYNLAEVANSDVEHRTNRGIAFVYEPGSVFKIVTASAALEEGVFKETDKIFCENGEYRVANHTLHDHDPLGTLTFSEVIEKSSNIGTVKIAQKLGPNKIYEYGKRFHFGSKTGIDLEGEVGGNLKPVSQWSKTSIGAVPIGQEVTVTPLQLVAAISAIANDGVFMKPFVVKYIKDNKDELINAIEPQQVGERAISPETAARMKVILSKVVETGTAKKAQIPGVTVAGKTGTAQKVVNGTYSHGSFYASFMGFAPVENPRLAAIVVFDEPHPVYYGGSVAAPIFQEVISNALKYLDANQPGN
jgi:cell division protein FtsI/penicillin-binding protein 2